VEGRLLCQAEAKPLVTMWPAATICAQNQGVGLEERPWMWAVITWGLFTCANSPV
jgi:hypothetical protein